MAYHNEKFLLQGLQFIAIPSDAIKWWEVGYDVLKDLACSLIVLRKSSWCCCWETLICSIWLILSFSNEIVDDSLYIASVVNTIVISNKIQAHVKRFSRYWNEQRKYIWRIIAICKIFKIDFEILPQYHIFNLEY